ncbi:Methyltransferase FkbM family protein [Tumidithrix helvetica PCC 7403]|uniref:FkbM family methyltransferase n=1 Tax=Tumidithrix helvetica TaxID=3457545 RepID=UPI003C9A333A
MNFSGIPNQSLLGKILRLPLRLLPANLIVPILQGKLRGQKWITGSSNHGCWLGSYELDKRLLIEQTIQEGKVFIDLGAHVGFYTLLASKLVGEHGKVFAFEPVPSNLQYLRRHLQINQVDNVKVLAIAVSDSNGSANFEPSKGSSQGYLSNQGGLMVETASLDRLIADGILPNPDYIKMDVEGAEASILSGAKSMLAEVHPTIFLATHGEEVKEQCLTILRSLNYQLTAIGGSNLEKADEILATYSS